MTTSTEDRLRQEDQSRYGVEDSDYCYFVNRLNVRELGLVFRINISDTVIFHKAEPVFKVYCVNADQMELRIERERDKMLPPEILSFFEKPNPHIQLSDPKQQEKYNLLMVLATRSQST